VLAEQHAGRAAPEGLASVMPRALVVMAAPTRESRCASSRGLPPLYKSRMEPYRPTRSPVKMSWRWTPASIPCKQAVGRRVALDALYTRHAF
jgi:hypothetical protein